jgi:hypothetical protein
MPAGRINNIILRLLAQLTKLKAKLLNALQLEHCCRFDPLLSVSFVYVSGLIARFGALI